MRLQRRSMSYMASRAVISSCRCIGFDKSSSTALSLASISPGSCKGWSIHVRSSLPPMAVPVLSNRYRSVFFLLPSALSGCVSSRLRREFASMCMYFVRCSTRMRLIWHKEFFCVSSRYAISAPAADMAQGISSQPKPDRVDTPKWLRSRCFAPVYSYAQLP